MPVLSKFEGNPDLFVVTSGFYGSESCPGVSREVCTPSGARFSGVTQKCEGFLNIFESRPSVDKKIIKHVAKPVLRFRSRVNDSLMLCFLLLGVKKSGTLNFLGGIRSWGGWPMFQASL